jgi:hypothetical protein
MRDWLAQRSSSIYYFLQVGVIIVTFTAGSLTGAVASYINLRMDAETLRSRVAVVENQVSDIRAEVAQWRMEDREFAAEMRKSMASINALLMAPPRR